MGSIIYMEERVVAALEGSGRQICVMSARASSTKSAASNAQRAANAFCASSLITEVLTLTTRDFLCKLSSVSRGNCLPS